jgi:NADP-dependent 3-hydroxy acid dehydrogenase YdfG
VSTPEGIDAGIARDLLMCAVRVRAAARDEDALNDIIVALTDLDEAIAQGTWLALVRKAVWLVERADKGG